MSWLDPEYNTPRYRWYRFKKDLREELAHHLFEFIKHSDVVEHFRQSAVRQCVLDAQEANTNLAARVVSAEDEARRVRNERYAWEQAKEDAQQRLIEFERKYERDTEQLHLRLHERVKALHELKMENTALHTRVDELLAQQRGDGSTS